MSTVRELLQTAFHRAGRHPLTPVHNARRLFHGRSDGIEGLVIERFGPVLIVQAHEGRLDADLDEIRDDLSLMLNPLGIASVYLKSFVRDRSQAEAASEQSHRNPTPWIGEESPEQLTICEHGRRYIVRPYDGFSCGLFLEQSDNRQRIHNLSRGRRVLNTFAYTCAFSVAAISGGAASVDSLDLSRRYLEWGKANFAENQLATDGHLFFCSDIFEFYARAKRQGRRYDLIVLDPPTFSKTRRPQRVFVLREQLDLLVSGALGLLEPGGILLLSTNDRALSTRVLEACLHRADAARPCRILERPELPADFPGDPDYSKSILATFDGA